MMNTVASTIDYTNDEFFKCYSILKDVVSVYKKFIYNTKLYELKSKYKNDEETFKRMKEELIAGSIQDILSRFISKYCYNMISRYLAQDFLVLQLTNYLAHDEQTK